MPTNKLTFIDLFAGIGGFRRGMELAGHKCIGFCEWDKFATASYTSMHLITDEQRQKLAGMSLKERQKEILKDEYRNGEWYSPDIRSVGAGNVPRVDCWCFGAPCQSFSLAGKRKGLDGKSGLIREVFRILSELEEKDRPEWLIYENVKGMLSSNRGNDFLSIILAMEELGYDISWQVFNSKYHGVPQNRERVYTLGHLRRHGERKVFPLCGADGEDRVQRKINIIAHRDGYRRNTQTFDYNGITEALDTAAGCGREQHTAIPMFGIDYNTSGQEREIANAMTTRNNVNGVGNVNQDGTAVCVPMCIDPQGRTTKEVQPSDTAPTLRAQAHGNNPEICIPVLTPDRVEKRQNGRRFKDNGEEAFTLTAQDRHGVALKIREATVKGYAEAEIGDSVNLSMPGSKTRRGRVGKKQANTLDTSCEQGVVVPVVWYEKYKCYIAIRKLTPKECFRLQSFSDEDFAKAQFVNSDSQLYKQAGNSVTVNVVYDIAKAIGECE